MMKCIDCDRELSPAAKTCPGCGCWGFRLSGVTCATCKHRFHTRTGDSHDDCPQCGNPWPETDEVRKIRKQTKEMADENFRRRLER